MRRAILLLTAIAALSANAQDLAKRHALIDSLYKAEKYAQVVKEIDLQLKEAAGTTWADSSHLYLYKYGRAHRKLKDAEAGVKAAERIYALVKQRGIAANELEALFDLSWTYYDVGRMKECARVDSIAVTVADRDPKVSYKQKGRARQYLAFDFSVIGDHRRSAKYALEAIVQYQKADTIPPAQWAESYTAAGVANWHMGRIREAEGYYLKALEILGNSEAEPILIRKVSTNGNLGVLWQNAGDFVRAKSYYHESLRNSDRVIANAKDQFTRDEAIVNRSRTYLNLGTVYFQLGDEGRARELLDMAWKDRSSVLEPDDPQLLVVRDRIADLEIAQGSLDKAEEWVTAYLVACEKKFGKRSEEYIRASSKLGDIALRKGQANKADSLFRVSLEAGLSNTDEKTDAVRVLTLQSRAHAYVQAGRMKDAIADLLEARRILTNIYDSSHYKVAHCDVLLAEAAMEGGDAAGALAFARTAIGTLKDRTHALMASKAPMAFPDPHILPDAIYWSVRAQRALAPKGTVKKEWNDDLDLAITALARNKTAVTDEASKLLLIGAQKRLFDLAMDVAYDAYAKSGSEADIERFLQLSEADRSILLKSRLNTFAGIRFSGVPDSIVAKEQELIAAIDLDEEDRAAATDMDRREKAYADFIVRLEKEHPNYFRLRYGESSISLAEVRKRLLTTDRDLLVYARTDDHLYMVVVSMQRAGLIRVVAKGIPEEVKALNGSIASRNTSAYVAAAHGLYSRVFAPVADQLTNKELLIIPDGALHTLSFEALLSSPDVKDFRKNLLIQRYTIAYLLSATTALQFADMARDRAKGVLAIAPGFSDELKQEYLTRVQDSTLIDRSYLDYVRQPFAVSTAQDLGNALSAKVMVGGAANEKGFRDLAARYGILHLGTHAEVNATSPMYSRLVLSKDGSGVDPDADGYLHAYEIYELDLRAQLAVLTACETGTGRNDAGEGVRSLGYGFAYAGCPSLVVSLWSIDEKVSAGIIARFYELLAEGLPKHEALRQAKLDHLANAPDELALPYYWAGMVIVGDVAPMELGSARSRWPWIAGTLVITLALFIWLRRRRAKV
ncbi:MAG: CHAT domain-containing protein [Flavobacteriales bacterium]|nr:CHAT domain-containing protein [Flavobacteriales bacterium]